MPGIHEYGDRSILCVPGRALLPDSTSTNPSLPLQGAGADECCPVSLSLCPPPTPCLMCTGASSRQPPSLRSFRNTPQQVPGIHEYGDRSVYQDAATLPCRFRALPVGRLVDQLVWLEELQELCAARGGGGK
jgi:hypothetical protein